MLDPKCAGAGLFLSEEVLIKSLHEDGAANANAHVVLNHQLSKSLAVDENDALRQVPHVLNRVAAEA